MWIPILQGHHSDTPGFETYGLISFQRIRDIDGPVRWLAKDNNNQQVGADNNVDADDRLDLKCTCKIQLSTSSLVDNLAMRDFWYSICQKSEESLLIQKDLSKSLAQTHIDIKINWG